MRSMQCTTASAASRHDYPGRSRRGRHPVSTSIMRFYQKSICIFGLSLLLGPVAFAQTGKIAGTITDAESGETLVGVNVLIEGTTQGSVTDVDGYYVILNVSPRSAEHTSE